MVDVILDQPKVNKLMGSLKRDELKFYQFYNIDFSSDEYQFQKYMQEIKENKEAATTKILNKTYYDIEVFYDPAVFPDAEKAKYAINAIAVYNNMDNTAVIFTCPYYQDIHKKTFHQCNETNQEILQKEVRELYGTICEENETYNIPGITIDVEVFRTEEELLKTFFLHLRSLETLFLIGFNSSLFDDPYIVRRGLNLCGDSIYDYISEFGEVSSFSGRKFDWPDYIKVDLLSLYKPVDQGGSGLGKSLPNFKLNTVAKKELKISKLDLDDMNSTYKNNLARFLTYNLLDTLLTFKLDEKLKFLELNWTLSKLNTAPMGSTIRGRSVMYKYRNNLIYTKRQQVVRAKPFSREIFYPFEE